MQSMIMYKPYLSILTGFSMLGAVCFYAVICWQGHSNRPSSAELRAKRAIRTKRRKEEMEKREAENARRRIEGKEAAVAKSRDSVQLKQRNITIKATEQENGGSENSGSEVEQ